MLINYINNNNNNNNNKPVFFENQKFHFPATPCEIRKKYSESVSEPMRINPNQSEKCFESRLLKNLEN